MQLVIVVLAFLPGPKYSNLSFVYANAVLREVYSVVSGMYPSLVVIIVDQHRSIADTCSVTINTKPKNNLGGDERPATAGHLSFASPPTDSKPDIE